MKRAGRFAVGVVAWAVAGWAASASEATPGSRGTLRYAEFVQVAAQSDEVVLWEGLPHPMFERVAYDEERAKRQTFLIGVDAFYLKPMGLNAQDAAALSAAVLKHRDNFQPSHGFSFCGGFHADYALEWQLKGTTVAEALFCFSCHEAQFRVGHRVERVNLSPQGFKAFRVLLAQRRQQRPVTLAGAAVKKTAPPPAEVELPKVATPPVEPIAIPAPPAHVTPTPEDGT